jgi:hypothetical protein
MEWKVNEILSAIALIGGSVAFILGLLQYRKGQQWKRAEWVAQEMKLFFSDPMVQNSLQMIDWGKRRILLFPHREKFEERYVVVADENVRQALLPHNERPQFTVIEAAIRDSFDRFLDGLERFESYVATGLVHPADLQPYLSYWGYHIASAQSGDPKEERLVQLREYMGRYGYVGALRLIKRLRQAYELSAGDAA